MEIPQIVSQGPLSRLSEIIIKPPVLQFSALESVVSLHVKA